MAFAVLIPILGGIISAVGAVAAAVMSKPSDPPAPVVPAAPPPIPEEAIVEPEGVIAQELARNRELARNKSAQSEQFLKLSKEEAPELSVTKISSPSPEQELI